MGRRPTITAALITLNEQRNLSALLPQLAWTDEIVVVDGRSGDASVQIAADHGCRVEVRPFDDFANQRNHALDMARGDWVLSMDADERPTRGLVDEIRRRVASPRYAGYRLPIRSRIFGRQFRYCGTQDDRPVRLFRRETARWCGDVHEVLQVRGRVGQLRGWLTHDTIPDLTTFLGKMDRYTTLEARWRVAAGRPPRRRDAWLAPWVEVFRRLVWKKGLLDGPQGWTFGLLSGLSKWVEADKHARYWRREHGT